jgi:Zn-dependent protease
VEIQRHQCQANSELKKLTLSIKEFTIMQGGLRVGNLLGIPFYIDYSWFPIAGLVTLSYALDLSQDYPKTPFLLILLGGALMALGLFSSVLAHELAHSFVALLQGIRVNSITLFVFGGMAAIDREARRPIGAFAVAIAGPLFSLALATLFFWILREDWLPQSSFWVSWIQRLASINLVIGVFNLLPGLPLDGGQVLKAVIWGLTGNRSQGILWAARSGQWVGMSLLGVALWSVFVWERVEGLWIGLVGLFILNNARNYAQYSQLQQIVAGLKARDAMTRNFRVLDANMSLREFVDRYLILPEQEASPEVFFAESDGRYRGLVQPEKVRLIERSDWEQLTLSAILTPMDHLQGVGEDSPLPQVIALMQQTELRQVPVFTPSGSIAGLINKGDIVAALGHHMGVTISPEFLQRIRQNNEFPPGFPIGSEGPDLK